MNAKHTPGPWFLDVDGPGWDIHVTSGGPYYCEGSRPVAVWYRSAASRDGHEERFANARLIAAAPDLKDTLKDLLRHYVQLVKSGDAGNWDPETEIVVKDARKALSQASGEAA